MREWNDNFDRQATINGKRITVGEQSFEDSTILIKEEDGTVLECPMGMDENGDIYFIYDNEEFWLKWLY